MKHPLLLFLIVVGLLSIASDGPAASPKRGWAGGDGDEINASNASWYYRWWHDIPASASNAIPQFVPLIKFYSTPQNLQNKLDIINGIPGVDTLLVLNEPERPEQSNVTVQDALGLWPQVQTNLPTHKLVSPAVSDNAEGRAWLDAFMSEVETLNGNANPNDDLRVDAIAFHWYGASSPNNPAGAAANFLSRVDWYHQTYNRPVWITEFAMHDWEGNDTVESMIQANAQFLEIVIPQLESRSYVEAYSFYQSFEDSAMYVDNPLEPLEPSPIGDAYIGTLTQGQTQDLGGVSLGTDVVYLRGASLINSGPAVADATRGVDALEGANTFGGASDWSIPPLREAYLRVRQGATLVKEGASAVDVRSSVDIEGGLHIAEGTVRFLDGQFSGEGSTRVDNGATLGTSWQNGRGVYTLGGHTLDVAGRVEGPVRLDDGGALLTRGTTAVFDSNLIVEASVIDIGGSSSGGGAPLVTPVSTGLQLEFDAANDAPGDSTWTDTTGSGNNFTFSQPRSPVAVVDPTFSTLTHAYPVGPGGGATGLNQFFEAGSPQRSRQDATFEVVFHVDDPAAGNDQVLWEVGGANRGAAMVLDGDVLTFNVDGDGADVEITHTIGAGWRHAVGVIDIDAGGDSVTLYIDGQPVGTLPGLTIGDWAGGNISGLGAGADSATGVSAGVGAPFDGQLAIQRYYQNTAFGASDALQNYQALTSGFQFTPSSLLVEGDLTLDEGAVLRVDLGDGGASDLLGVLGTLDLADAHGEVGFVGATPLGPGAQFDLIDAGATLGEFATMTLPSLAPGLMWNLDRLALDGTILVTLSGDYNGDGAVDAADYSVWRDQMGATVPQNSGADGNGDGVIDSQDYDSWANNFGAQWPGPGSAIPEPHGLAILAIAATGLSLPARRTRRRIR